MSGLISVAEALALIEQHRPQPGVETVPLHDALNRTLAAPLKANVSRPPNDVSAMDGYAVRLADVGAPNARLTIIGEAPAGQPLDTSLNSGEAVRIFTGGVLPPGADHIVPQENTEATDETVTILEAANAPRFVRKAGRDFHTGEVLIDAGVCLGPAELAVAAAANHAALPVQKRLKIGLLANGNELRAPGSALSKGQIVNSNPAGLMPLIAQWGAEAIDLGTASDSEQSIQDYISGAGDIDILVPIGGASVGDHDHMRPAFAGLGFDPIFEKVAVRPGKPTWFSRKGDQLTLGLPGNPASAFVCAHIFLKPLISAGANNRPVNATLAKGLPSNGARATYMRACATLGKDGVLSVEAAEDQDSSLLTPFLSANCFILRAPDAPAVQANTAVTILMIKPL